MIEIAGARVRLRSPGVEDVEALGALTEDDAASFASPGQTTRATPEADRAEPDAHSGG